MTNRKQAKRKRGDALAANHRLVFDALKRASRPMTAYQLLDAVRPLGVEGPPTVYRALDRLQARGAVHRLDSLNAYVACAHEARHEAACAFLICDDCGDTVEVSDRRTSLALENLAAAKRFALRALTIELRGLCRACAGG